MHFIRTQALTLKYADHILIKDLNLTLQGKVGIIGQNGAGKSTLLRALAFDERVRRSGRISYLAQDLENHGTVADALGVSKTLDILARSDRGEAYAEELDLSPEDWSLRERLALALRRAELKVDLDRRLTTLSVGELTRLGLAALALSESEILILDEPTNHLDLDSRIAFYQFVREFKCTLIVASHDQALLREMETIIDLRNGIAHSYGGNYSFYEQERAKEKEAEESVIRNASRVLKHTRRSSEITAMRQRERQRQGKKKAPLAGIPKIKLGEMKRNAERTAASLRNIHEIRVQEAQENLSEARRARVRRTFSIRVAQSESRGLCAALRRVNQKVQGIFLWEKPVSLSIHSGSRIWLQGKNGSGKSTLCRLLLNLLPLDEGLIERKGTIAMLDQKGDALLLRESGETWIHSPLHQGRTEMSGGEKMHSSLRKILESGPDLLILDEPTNHLDLERTRALGESLKQYNGSLLIVSHDADFTEALGPTERFVLERRKQ